MKKKRWLPILVTLVMVFAMATPAYAATGDEFVTNGGFEAGDTGFDSDYEYVIANSNTDVRDELWDPGTYGVGDNPYEYHNLWTSFADHTATGPGNMMIVNAKDETPSGDIWSQTLTLPTFNPTPVTAVTLFAGQNMDAGDVLIKYVDGHVWAKIVITGELDGHDGWLITQIHMQAANSEAGIPQTKNGNPIPGNFAVNETFDPGIPYTEWFDLGAFVEGAPMVIAAHAKLVHAEVGHMDTYNFCIASGTATDLVGGGDAVVTPANTWLGINNTINAALPCEPPNTAQYIWDAVAVTGGAGGVADIGGYVDFTHAFNIIGTPTSATLMMAADNAFAFHFNAGTEVDENLSSDWRTEILAGNFDPPITQGDAGGDPDDVVVLDANPTGWSQIYTYTNVLADLLTGANVFNATAVNADWNTTIPSVNPAMLIYKLCGTSELWVVDEEYASETGWGDGTQFPGANWSEYITYTPYVPEAPTYEFSFWAANSYPSNPAVLAIMVDGVEIGTADLKTIGLMPGETDKYKTGEWKLFTFTLSGVSGSTKISIQNQYNIYGGDDFALDDISLVQN